MQLEKFLSLFLLPLCIFSLNAETQGCIYYPETICSPYYLKNQVWDVSFKGSYLFWQTAQDGLDISVDNIYVEHYSHPYRGRTYGVSFPFRSGFQIEAVCNTGINDICLKAIYTWLSPKLKENISQDPGINTFPYFSVNPKEKVPNSTIFVIDHFATFQQYYNLLDLYLYRATSISSAFELDFSLGLRSTWQKQNWYSNELMFTLNPITSNYLYDFTQKFSGSGAIFQLESRIYFFKNFKYIYPLALYFKSGCSLLLGTTTATALLSAKSPFTFLNYFDSKSSIFSLIPVFDFSTGLVYELLLEKKRYWIQQLNFDALFETQSWVGYNKMLCLTLNQRARYNMTVVGLTFGMELVF